MRAEEPMPGEYEEGYDAGMIENYDEGGEYQYE